ncbi:hypothetical protein HaloA020_20680 [Halomonas sp. A020]|nr:hypothetical protein HaloA020_20680 [Halomonas sp. A020]
MEASTGLYLGARGAGVPTLWVVWAGVDVKIITLSVIFLTLICKYRHINAI